MASLVNFPQIHVDPIFAIIPASSTTSDIVDCGGATLCGLGFPAGWAGTTLTFKVSNAPAATPHSFLYDGVSGDIVTLDAPAGSSFITFSPALFAGFRFISMVSAVAVAAEKKVEMLLRAV